MKYHLFARTNAPTSVELGPRLEDVFHDPERYRPYFKPILKVGDPELCLGAPSPLFFIYTSFATNGPSLQFRLREGKYELVDVRGKGQVELVEDIPAYFEKWGLESDEEDPLDGVVVEFDNQKPDTGQWLKLYPLETDLCPEDDDWYDLENELNASVGNRWNELGYSKGYFGGKPSWLQSYWMEDDWLNDKFVGQLAMGEYGYFYSIMGYLFVERIGEDTVVQMMWEET